MMIKIFEYFKKHKLLFFGALILFVLKILFIEQIFLLRGERDVALTGYSLARTARDIYGIFLPLEFKNLDMPTPFLSFYFSALWFLFLPFKSVFFARLPYVIFSLSLLFLVYEFIYLITKEKKLSLITSLVFSFSPGVFHLTRLSLEIGLVIPLLVLAMILYIKKNRLWSYLFFILSYFTYNGVRPIIPFILIYLEMYFLLLNKNWWVFLKENIKNIVFFLIIFVISARFIDGSMMASRKDDLVFFSFERINPLVIFNRNTAIGPKVLKLIFNNKITLTLNYMIGVLFQGQSLNYLFYKGDDAAIYATTFTGQFFFTLIIFYYLGILYLGKKWNRFYFYILGIIPSSLVSSVINIDYNSVAYRSMPASIGYAFIIACGLLLGWDLIKKVPKFVRNIIIYTIGMIFMIELFCFVYNYYFRRPITMSEMFFESERQIALFLLKAKKPYIIYDDSPRNIYATYSYFKPNMDIKKMQENFRKGIPYKFDKFTLQICPSSPKDLPLKSGIIVADSCTDEQLYENLDKNGKIEKIPFKDYSLRQAFFIIP